MSELAVRTLPEEQGQGTLLSVVPIPGTTMALAIIGHVIQAAELPQGPETEPSPGPPLPADLTGVVVDPVTRKAWSNGIELRLPYREFELLAYLAAHPKQVFSRLQLLRTVWGLDYGPHGRTVDVHIHRLRRKLGPNGHQLITIRRVGYKFDPA